MPRRILSLAALLSFWFYLTACSSHTTLRGYASKVTDGDTFTLVTADHQKHRIRLSEIDTPERKQNYGSTSTLALKSWLIGNQITVRYEEKDRYNRIIGDVSVNNHNINKWMVQHGHAWHYKKYSDSQELANLQASAQSARIGLFSAPSPTPPWTYRRQQRQRR